MVSTEWVPILPESRARRLVRVAWQRADGSGCSTTAEATSYCRAVHTRAEAQPPRPAKAACACGVLHPRWVYDA